MTTAVPSDGAQREHDPQGYVRRLLRLARYFDRIGAPDEADGARELAREVVLEVALATSTTSTTTYSSKFGTT